MNLCFRKFTPEDYPEYASWFNNPELNRRLGPMDTVWLNDVTSRDEADGVTWAVFLDKGMVGVVETAFDRQQRQPAAVVGIAVKPDCRRQGIGTAILRQLLFMHEQNGITCHCAFIHVDNFASRRLFEKVGFSAVSLEPDKNGFLEYRYLAP